MEPKIDDLQAIGDGLNRPECVLTHKSGLIFTSNCTENGGISIISPNGNCTNLLGTDAQNALKPNGIALEPEGSFLMAHLGATEGGIFRITTNGDISAVVTHANGERLPPTNFILIDSLDRLWITVSTTLMPRERDYRSCAHTGFIALALPGQSNARIVASNLGYTNECIVDLDNAALYVNETFGRRLTRFDLSDDGSLSNPHVLTTFTSGTYPDGLAQDDAGDLWVTSIVSNRIIKVSANGEQQMVLEDVDADHLDKTEAAYLSDSMRSSHLEATGNTRLKNISSLAFGGTDLCQIYLGNLLDTHLHSFQVNTPGRALPHWDLPLGNLEKYL